MCPCAIETRKDIAAMPTADTAAAARPRRFLSRRAQAERYGTSVKTIQRWGKDPEKAMPREFIFNRLPCRDEAELEAWERARIAVSA
jgi:hypothetical protein